MLRQRLPLIIWFNKTLEENTGLCFPNLRDTKYNKYEVIRELSL